MADMSLCNQAGQPAESGNMSLCCSPWKEADKNDQGGGAMLCPFIATVQLQEIRVQLYTSCLCY